MKVVISLKPLRSSSKTRGIGVYTKELLNALSKTFPEDSYTPSAQDYYREETDLVHLPFFDTFFLTFPWRRPKPTVVTIHDLIPIKFKKHFPKGIRGFIKWRIQKYFVRKVDHIITDSESSKKDIVKILSVPKEKVTVIPLAPSVEYQDVPKKLERMVKEDYKLPEKYLLYVGDINWNKNITGLIEEFEKVKDDEVELILVGKAFEEPHSKELEEINARIEASPAKDRIKKIGFVPTHHLPALYSLAYIYVQASWYEGFGLPILEAMQHGCPVVTSGRGSLKEVAGDSAAIVDPGKKGEIAKELNSLIKSKEKRDKLIDLGRKRAKEFTWEKTARETRKVYESLVK